MAHDVAGLPWAPAFVLGAVLSPTDPIAASAIASRLGAPRRFVTIVEGESLVNDATGLTLYKLAVAAAVGSGVTLLGGAGTFVVNAVGGIAIGLVAAWFLARVRARVDDAPTEIVVSLLSPYLAYLPAEAAGVSAVLAAVTCGVVLGWRVPRAVAPATRLQSFATWEVVVFAVEAGIFVLVGLSLPTVVQRIDGAALGTLVRDGAAVVATVVAVRFAWTFVVGALPAAPARAARARRRAALGGGPARGLHRDARRGVVAAALAIPLQTDAGDALPGRDLIIFLTYVVVVVTVVGQGLALPRLLRRIAPEGPGDQVEREEDEARVAAARAALEHLDELGDDAAVPDRTLRRLRELYRFRLDRFAARLEGDGREDLEEDSVAYQRLRHDLLERERRAIIDLRDAGRITDDALRRVEHDLDLDESRLELSEGVGPHGASPLQLGDGE